MKLQQLVFPFLIAVSAFQICSGQEKLKAELIGTFGKISNDPLQAIIFNFIENLDEANSKGYIIIHKEKNDPLLKYLVERRIKGCLRLSGRSTENLVFAIGAKRSEHEVELWKVPNGADKPQFTETLEDYKLPDLTNPRLIYKLNTYDEYCPLGFDMEFYSRFLKANPYLNGKIVIYEKSLKNYQKVRQEYIRELTEANKISPRQIKFIRGKYYGESDAEFWLVARNTK